MSIQHRSLCSLNIYFCLINYWPFNQMCACQHSKECSSSIKEISWLPTISFQGGCCSVMHFWHPLGMLVQTFVCVWLMFEAQKVQCSFSDDCPARKSTWNQWMPLSHQSMARAYKIYITTITFSVQHTFSSLSHMTAVSDLLSEMSLKRNCHDGTMSIGFNYTQTFVEPFSINTRLNCLIKHVQNAEI